LPSRVGAAGQRRGGAAYETNVLRMKNLHKTSAEVSGIAQRDEFERKRNVASGDRNEGNDSRAQLDSSRREEYHAKHSESDEAIA